MMERKKKKQNKTQRSVACVPTGQSWEDREHVFTNTKETQLSYHTKDGLKICQILKNLGYMYNTVNKQPNGIFFFNLITIHKILGLPLPFRKPLRRSDSDSSHGKLGFHTNKLKLHIPPCSATRWTGTYYTDRKQTHLKRLTGNRAHLCNRIVIKSDLLTMLDFTNTINTNLIMTINSSNSENTIQKGNGQAN